MIVKYAAGLSISQICSGDMPLQRQQFFHMMAYIAKSLCLMFCCLFLCAIFVCLYVTISVVSHSACKQTSWLATESRKL